MKNLLSLLFALYFGNVAFSQNTQISNIDSVKEEKTVAYFIVDQMPVFNPDVCMKLPESERYNCSQIEIKKYISRNLTYPYEALENDIQGVVYIRFIIDITGKVTDVTVAKGVHKLLDDAALEFVSNMPDFIPGFQNGKEVRVELIIPISYMLITDIDKKKKK